MFYNNVIQTGPQPYQFTPLSQPIRAPTEEFSLKVTVIVGSILAVGAVVIVLVLLPVHLQGASSITFSTTTTTTASTTSDKESMSLIFEEYYLYFL
jgi:hypothetical protein